MAHTRQPAKTPSKTMQSLADVESILERFGFGIILANSDLSIAYSSKSASQWTSSAKNLCETMSAVCPGKTPAEWTSLANEAMDADGPIRLSGNVYNEFGSDPADLPIALTKYTGQPGTANQLLVLLGPIHDDHIAANTLHQPDPLAALGRLTAKIAHELNNPLDGISRYVNLALRIADDTDPSKLKHYLGESRSGLIRMTRIIADLLEYSRNVSATEEMSLQRMVEDAIQAVTASTSMKGIVVAVNFKTIDLPAVIGPRLYQVCCNLIKNAVDAMPTGGRLTITVGTTVDTVLIRIEDTGAGLPDNSDQIFEPFYTTKKPGEGTGLGLAICKEYILSMDGTIQAKPGEEGGAVITIAIPIEQFRVGSDQESR